MDHDELHMWKQSAFGLFAMKGVKLEFGISRVEGTIGGLWSIPEAEWPCDVVMCWSPESPASVLLHLRLILRWVLHTLRGTNGDSSKP